MRRDKRLKLAIIVPTFNRRKYLKRLLAQLSMQKVTGCHLEIVTVVDGSTDGTIEMLKKVFPDVHIVHGTGNWWFTKSINEGFKFAEKLKPDYLLIMNDDSEISPDFLSKLFSAQEKLGKNAIIGSMSVSLSQPHRVTFSGVKKINWWRLKKYNYLQPFYQTNIDKLTGTYPSKVLNGRGTLVPAQVLKFLNYFDEKLPQYGSDDDFALRAIKSGFPVYISWDAKVFDHVDMTSAGTAYLSTSVLQFYKSFFNRYSVNSISKAARIFRKHGKWYLVPIHIILFILGTSKAHFYKYPVKQRGGT